MTLTYIEEICKRELYILLIYDNYELFLETKILKICFMTSAIILQ